MSTPLVLIPRGGKLGEGFTKQEQFEGTHVHPGRRTDGKQSAASWIADLTDTRKVILLCGWCRPKFNPRRHGYRKFYSPDLTGRTDGYMSNGMCDACKQQTALTPGGGTAFISEATYSQACMDPAQARRVARARAGMTSVWSRITEFWGTRRPREASGRSGR
jgi:hypothetical protein